MIYVNQHALADNQVKVRTMNFGQHWREEGVTECSYKLIIPLAEVRAFLNTEIADYVSDAKKYPDEDYLLDELLERYDWPNTLDKCLALDDEILINAILDFVGHDLLLFYCSDGVTSNTSFVLNSINDICIISGEIIVKGKGRERSSSTLYQDA